MPNTGTLAYVIALSLIFTRRYDDLAKYPPSLTSMIIVTIVGSPGKPLGACFQRIVLAMAGVFLGGAVFTILAKLSSVPVAQGIIFAAFVYGVAIVKTFGQKYFDFVLLSVLMAFDGIYTSRLLQGVFSPTYLLEYLKSYAWGAGIVLAVNVLIFPRTSERELRQTIVTSLEHIATFAALLERAYILTSTEEDLTARELLSEVIKADFAFMTQKIEETSLEINWSKYSMQDYQRFIDRVRMLQRTLLTAHISLLRLDEKDVEVFRDDILPQTKATFMKLRRDIDVTIREIGGILGHRPMFIAATQSGYMEFLAQQRAATISGKTPALPQPNRKMSLLKAMEEGNTSKSQPKNHQMDEKQAFDTRRQGDVEADLRDVTQRLQMEFGTETPTAAVSDDLPRTPEHSHTIERKPSLPNTSSTGIERENLPNHSKLPLRAAVLSRQMVTPKNQPKPKYGPHVIQDHFGEFKAQQKDILVQLLTSADPGQEMELKIDEPGPSISELYGGDYLRGNVQEGDLPTIWARSRRSARPTPMQSARVSVSDIGEARVVDSDQWEEKKRTRRTVIDDDEINLDDISVGPTSQFKRNETLLRVYSLLFAWDGFVKVVSSFHAETQVKRRNRIHVHFYESILRPGAKPMPENGMSEEDDDLLKEEARELSIKEALALLENQPYTPTKVTWMQKLDKANRWLSSERSVFSMKVAAAATVFATLIFADTTAQWFINYNLTSGLLTCVVALAPTLGQSLKTFLFQISGSGLGTLVGWTVLQMWKNVGGYSYNPYGMVAIIGIFAIPLIYCQYERPALFVLALLSLNSAGTITSGEVIYVNYYGRKDFDTPALRAGKQITTLVIALGIVIVFQLFILRNPARRTLRKALGRLVYANLAYNTILQAYVRAVMPADLKYRAKPTVIRRIERELKHREAKMQAQILEMSPLVVYAATEPSFKTTFRGDTAHIIIESSQIILDRLREARSAIGAEPFNPFILENLVSVLSPYRRRATRINKTGLYLCAMSLLSKSPLPHDSVLTQHLLNHLVHDALLISSRWTRTEEGQKAIRSDSFTRYWFYLINVSGLQTQLKRIEGACKDLFGELEDDPKIQ